MDSNDEATAQRYFIIGLRAAHSSTDRVIGANILTCMSKHATMIRVTRSGWPSRRWPARRTSPRRWEASIQGSLAGAAARAGDATTVARAQGRMFELTAAVDPAVEPPYIYWWSDAEAHWAAGSSALFLGDPWQAEAH